MIFAALFVLVAGLTCVPRLIAGWIADFAALAGRSLSAGPV
jgi:hypothetical protein